MEFNRRILLGCKLESNELRQLAERVQNHWDSFPDEAGEMLYPDVLPALEKFRSQGLILGIVSHRTLPVIQCSPRRHGLMRYIQVLVSPQVARASCGKPDLAMWEYALGQARIGAAEAAHLGDQYEHDVVGAKAARLFPILIDRKQCYFGKDCLRAKDLWEATSLFGL
ncbi:MAG: HAD family hydrolase [Candidatus Bipolaricaulota bacterium]|nr:HAD family hydrolase [Candidatus Bipolaricaulota bacterium]MDW8126771.1 HAD-IA family hydrolase [Candidatus Bipolaricaulota bacterium]